MFEQSKHSSPIPLSNYRGNWSSIDIDNTRALVNNPPGICKKQLEKRMENRERSVVSARIISTKMGNESDCTSGGCIISRIEAAALLLVLSKRDRKERSWPTPNGGRTIPTPPRRRVPGRLLFQISISSSKGGRHRWQAARMHKVVAVCGNDSKLSRAGGASYVKSTYSYSLSKFLGRFRAITAGEIVRGETCAGNIYIHTFCRNEKKKKRKKIYIYIFRLLIF